MDTLALALLTGIDHKTFVQTYEDLNLHETNKEWDLEEEKVIPKMPGDGDDEGARGGVPNPGSPLPGAPLPGAPLPGAPPVVPELDPQVKAYVA